MDKRYLGANIVVTLVDAHYDDTKDKLTDNDPDTAPTRLSAVELLALQSNLVEVLAISAIQAKQILETMRLSAIGQATVVVSANQFAALFMYVQDEELLRIVTQTLEVVVSHINLSGQSFLR